MVDTAGCRSAVVGTRGLIHCRARRSIVLSARQERNENVFRLLD